ncbi:polyphosphate kinase 2 [Pelagicoccus sp. SDUM812002]|uniref:polyphosphate kinase 2 n=1 Tax=Pelagicoccus sp. SDUM812002 TaxID=3041266 RepID=UPI00280E4F12|nr:polyphosphate kinase 2 [Pelagicoccus sp. SDUM812002]MDQ8186594.1 polyphosphate kinase 2 [Pelagicoccus sp. SDUM812002]
MKDSPEYQAELQDLQRELVLLQQDIANNNKRLLIIFEGRDAAGKGGAIRHFTRHLNPRAMRVIALPKPTEKELGQWFFQRYFLGLPNPGEIIFFDRSWYNRAVVEPVMGFCTKDQYEEFIGQVNNIEKMLIDDGIQIIKFWFSINRTAQHDRFEARKSDILKQWKLSTVDALAQEKWDDFTFYKEKMFERTHTLSSPWVIVNGNHKPKARLESIRHVLTQSDYEGKGTTGTRLHPDPKLIRPYDLDYLVAKRESDRL